MSDLRAGLAPLLAPRGIAVVGASTSPGKLGAAMLTSLATASVPVVPVNPSPAAVAGGMAPSIAEAAARHPGEVDLALLCLPAAAAAGAVRECAAAGIRAAVVCAGGFAEAGADDLEAELATAVAETGVRLLGPNTSGFFRPGSKLFASFVPGVASLSAGSVGVVAASGGVNHALAFALDRVGAGVSLGVGIGAGLDVTAPEVLDHLAADPATRAVALHLETVPDGPALLAAVHRLAAVKPVAALVVGRTDVGDFARSHTGALATSWAVTRALLAQAGAVVVDDEVQLVAAASALTAPRLPAAPRPGVALVTGQAGPGLIMADQLGTRDVVLPRLADATVAALGELLPPLTYLANPVDTGRPGPEYPQLLSTVAADAAVDLVGVYGITEPQVDLPAAVLAAEPGVPVVVAVDGPADDVARVRAGAPAGLPVLVGPSALVHGLDALVTDAARRAVAADAVPVPAVPAVGGGPWHEAAGKDVLDVLGATTPPRRVCATITDAQQALADLGGPVAVKLLDAAVLHKTELGGVHLGVRDADGMAAAVAALDAIGAQAYLVEQMAPSGVDLILGVRRDPVFGPVALLGLGGTAAEVLGDTVLVGLPATAGELAALPDGLAGRALLQGHRGGPVLDRDELAQLVAALGALLVANPRLAEVEVNPLRLTPTGLVALDAVLIPAAHPDSPHDPAPDDVEQP